MKFEKRQVHDDQYICLLIYQPRLYKYRELVLSALAKKIDIRIIDGSSNAFSALKWIKNTFSIFNIKIEYMFIINLIFDSRITHALLPTNLKSFAFYLAPLICRILHVKLFFHGQGDFSGKMSNIFYRELFRRSVSISYCYISYCDLLLRRKFFEAKISPVIVNNRFETIAMDRSIIDLTPSFNLLFIGRPRKGSCYEELFKVSYALSLRSISHTLHVIGIPNCKEFSLNASASTVFHGDIRDEKFIESIASNCSLGIYFGNCGLSSLHYMALGLCPVVHNDFSSHSGPEPRLITENVNGILFEKGSVQSCVDNLVNAKRNPDMLLRMRSSAYRFAKHLHSTPYSEDMLLALKS